MKTGVMIVAAWTAGALCAAETEAMPPELEKFAEGLTALVKGVSLADESGAPEQDLVDPFQRRTAEDAAAGDRRAEDGLMRTTMGEISPEFKILAITIPDDGARPRTALIQFYDSDEPIVIHEGDLVRVDRQGVANSRGRSRASMRSQRASTQAQELEEELSKFVFYLNVKHIEPTYIEVYHNKKRPDETIRLNW